MKSFHEIASRMAASVRASVAELQKRYDREQRSGFIQRDPMDWFPVSGEHDIELHKEIDVAVKEVRDWYSLLIQASNHVFQIEYWSRTLGPKAEAP